MSKDLLINAISRDLRVSSRKLNQVAGLIRRKTVESALLQLRFCKKRSAKDIKKCLESAIANAENNYKVLNIEDLIIEKVLVNQGGKTMKRVLPRAKGRADRVHKYSSSLEIALMLKK